MNTKNRPLQTKLRGLAYLCLSAVIGLLQPTSQAGEKTKITTTSSGSVQLDYPNGTEVRFNPVAATKQWKFSYGVKSRKTGNGAFRFTLFTPAAIEGTFKYTRKLNAVECKWDFQALKDCEFNTLAMEFKIPIKIFVNGTWETDKGSGILPEKFSKAGIFGAEVTRFSATSLQGQKLTITFPKPTHLGLEDDRKWGGQNYKLRFGKVFGKLNKGESFPLAATISVPGDVEFAVDDEVTIRPGKDWVPLVPDLEIKPGSALDLSKNGFAQGPCGSQGRVIVNQAGHFAFADTPKVSQRFYGANLCFTSQYMPKEKVDQLLDRWLRFGYNTLRIHHYEFRLTEPVWKTGLEWDPKRLDQLCYLIAGCAKRGIWLTTDLYVSRPVSPDQIDVPATPTYMKNQTMVGMKVYKDLVLLHEPAYQDFIKFTRKLLEHVNPYTGKRLADEPALAWISLVNEGSLGIASRIKQLPEWKVAWNRWLAAKYPNREDLSNALGNLANDEDPAKGNVKLPENIGRSDLRANAFRVFLADTESKFVERTRKFLRDELKCQALISNHNCGPHYLTDQTGREAYDYVDNHFYVDHPIFEKGRGLPSRCPNTNPVRSGAKGARESVKIRMWGKPLTISEFNYSGPGRFRGVGAILTGTQAALQDWDILWRFAYAHADREIFTPTPMDYFNISRDPLSLAADRAAVMAFLRKDVAVAPHRLATVIPQKALNSSLGQGLFGYTTKWSWQTRIGTAIGKAPEDAICINVTDTPEQANEKIKAAGLNLDRANGIIESETKQITLDKNNGVFCLDTPRTAGGYADAGQSIDASKAGVKVDNVSVGATVFVTSLNPAPIKTSSSLLVTHLTDLQNTGTKYGESARQTLLNWGHLPYLVRAGSADVHIKLSTPNDYTVWALSVAGHRLEKVPAKIDGDILSFTAKVRSAFGARMLYELTTDKQGADPEAQRFRVTEAAGSTLLDFKQPFLFSYVAWKDKATVADQVATIQSSSSQGGAGYNFNNGLDCSDLSDRSPVLYLTIGGKHQAKAIKALFVDATGKKGTYVFDLANQPQGKQLRILPRGNTSLGKPNQGDTIDVACIRQVQILGDWSPLPVDVKINRLSLEAPNGKNQ